MPVLLLVLFGFAATIGVCVIAFVLRGGSDKPAPRRVPRPAPRPAQPHWTSLIVRPGCWLAVRSRSLSSVQGALALHNPKPCSWTKGLAGDEKLFIAPPVKGWVLVTGCSLPEPSDDVDACFRFVLELSRKLGQVQFFSASRILNHHAWVKAERGRIARAYAWAGKTIWHQGTMTQAEKDLDLKCLAYAETCERTSFNLPDVPCMNVEKVPLLAARWSIDPARIDEGFLEAERGVAGELSRRY